MKYKLICFDLDGTIIDETIFIWQTLHDELGTDPVVRKKAAEDYYAGRITYAEWAEHDIKMWKEQSATKEKLLHAIRKLKLMKGARETLEELKQRKKHGLKIALISGSLDFALEYVLPDYKEIFDDIYINKVVFNDDGTINKIIPTAHDHVHKATALKEICEKENISIEESIFVGDHENDIYIAETAGFSIAFNCKSDKLAQISDVVIEKKDLREILPYFG
ncbi:HAD family hydrolase [Nanoarchaeota archaeon]